MLSKKTPAAAAPAADAPQAGAPIAPAVKTNIAPVVAVPAVPLAKSSAVPETSICVKLPDDFIEYIRNFQHAQAFKSGNLRFSFKDALCGIISAHQAAHPNIAPRPEIVKAAERKSKRK